MPWYGKTLFCRTSLKSGTATAVPAVPAAPPMKTTRSYKRRPRPPPPGSTTCL